MIAASPPQVSTARRWIEPFRILFSPLWGPRPGEVSLNRPDPRALRVGLLLLAVVILNAVDLMCTLFAEQIDFFKEMNPIADGFFRLGLTPSLICYKVLMVLCGTVMLWKLRRSRWAVPACWLLLVAFVALMVVWYVWMRDVTTGLELATSDWTGAGKQ